jgi:hypothetical protein
MTPEGNSNAARDVTTPDGVKIQVKGRRVRPEGRKPPHFSGVRNLARVLDEGRPLGGKIGDHEVRQLLGLGSHTSWQ